MKAFTRTLLAVTMAATAAPLLTTGAQAQALSGRALTDRPQLAVSYYKTPPGQQDEWLALYLKWHRPIMDYMIQQGFVTSATVYANAGHSVEPSWDYMIVIVLPAPDTAKKPTLTRGQIIQKLFPDLDAYTAGEKSRWAMTTAHWDQEVVEVDLTAKHPGIYYPIIPGVK